MIQVLRPRRDALELHQRHLGDDVLLELAEEPGLWLPPEPSRNVFAGDGYSVVTYGRSAWVHGSGSAPASVERRRSRRSGRSCASAASARRPGGSASARPRPDLAERLRALGLEPDDPPELTTLAIASRPAGEAAVEVRRAETLEDFLRALEIDWESFDLACRRAGRAAGRGRERLAADRRGRRVGVYLAYLGGEPVGFGRAIFTPWAALLLGGATLPEARGRGVYTSLVHARWDEAVERGVPRLVVSAGPMSAPILERLGFERLGGFAAARPSQ